MLNGGGGLQSSAQQMFVSSTSMLRDIFAGDIVTFQRGRKLTTTQANCLHRWVLVRISRTRAVFELRAHDNYNFFFV